MERIASVPSAKDTHLAANTSVWLDIDNCGVPDGGNSVAEDIKSALSNLGYSGAVSIFIYGSNIPESVQRADGDDVTPEIRNPKKVLVDLTRWAVKSPPPANILLLSDVNEFSKGVVDFLSDEGYTIRLARPIGGWSALELEEYTAAGLQARYIAARKPIYKSSVTSVWWDMLTCKPPSGCDIDKVGNNICAALFNVDYYGPVSIFTYGGDTDPKPHNDPFELRLPNCILFNHVSEHDITEVLPADMVQWVLQIRGPANILLVSSHTHLADAFEGSEYNVMFAVPSHDPTPSYPPGKTVWISSDLLAGGCPIVIDGEEFQGISSDFLEGIEDNDSASNAKDEYLGAITSIWWDMDDCRLPAVVFESVFENIKSALLKLGYHGPVCISAYGDATYIPAEVGLALRRSGISLIEIPPESYSTNPEGQNDKHTKLLENLMSWAVDNPAPANILLLSGDRAFSHAMHHWARSGYNILLSAQLPAATKTVWHWTSLLAGRPPIGTSRALAKYEAAKTSVWWDMEDCKIPEHCNVTSIGQNIRSALSNLGYRGLVGIRAYGGDTSDIPLSDQLALSGIYLKPAPLAGKVAKQIVMDMLNWIHQNRAPANLLLISGNQLFSSALRHIGKRFYNVLLCASLPVAAETVWHWSSLCLDGGSPIGRSSGEVSSKKMLNVSSSTVSQSGVAGPGEGDDVKAKKLTRNRRAKLRAKLRRNRRSQEIHEEVELQ